MAPLFLNLPGELRNRVYQLVLEHDTTVRRIKHSHEFNRSTEYITYSRYGDTRYGRWSRDEEAVLPSSYAGLTRVCRQIREEYLPLYVAHQKAHLSVFAGYDDLVDIPAILLDENTHRNTVTILEIRVRTTDSTLASYLDLLPILRARTFRLKCVVDKYENMKDELYLGYLLLSRILDHNHKEWFAMLREPAFVDAILFNLASRDIKIVLGPKGAAYIDGENARQVRNFLESMEVAKETKHSGTLVFRISDVTVSVTQARAVEAV